MARGERSQRTLEEYHAHWKNHLESEIGRRRIQSITSGDISRLVTRLRAKEKRVNGKPTGELLAAWTLHNITKVLRNIFKYAYRHEYIAADPVARVADELPTGKNKTQARVLAAEDVRKLIAAAPANYRTLIALVAYTGVRISEALGLIWDDVDFDTATLSIRRQVSRATQKQPAQRRPLKTNASERQIDIAPELLALLRQRREEAFARGYAKTDDYVFATLTGQPTYYRNAVVRGLDKAADRAGLNRDRLPRLGFHDLRHTAITHLVRSGADVAQVQRFAGHARPSITLDIYVGEFEKRKDNDSGRRLAAIYASSTDEAAVGSS